MQIELPYPAKILWPNGRGHHMAKHREAKKHRDWAAKATWSELSRLPGALHTLPDRVRIAATIYPKTRNAIDKDNAASSLKSYADGIAAALGVNDSRFDYAPIQFGEPVKNGKVIITIGEG